MVITLAWVFSTRREVAKRTRELRESEQRFRNLLENVQLVALTVNHDARITFAHDYTMGLTGWAIDELLAMDLLAVVVPPAGMPRWCGPPTGGAWRTSARPMGPSSTASASRS